jgi:hypothetical protein
LQTQDRYRQLLVGAGLTLGLVALGLYVTGNSARALSLVTPASKDGGFFVPRGSSGVVQTVILNGKPATVQLCRHPTRTPKSVLDAYRDVAANETLANVPYAIDETADGGTLVWATPDGSRKAVVVTPHPAGGSEFRLISEPTPSTVGQVLPQSTTLPGGIQAPPGFQVGFCVTQPGGTGSAMLEAPGTCREVAAGLLSELRGARFDTQRADAEANALNTQNTRRLVLPFEHASGALAGHLIVTPTRQGARACLTVRRTR